MLQIDCSVSGSNPSTIVYVRISGTDLAETTLPNDNRVFNVSDSVTLDFNGRTYTCSASNGETMTQIEYTVYVNQLPSPSSEL